LNWNSIRAWWFDPATKRLGYAVFISLIIHALFIEQSGWVVFSKLPAAFSTIDAELMPNKPQPVTQTAAPESEKVASEKPDVSEQAVSEIEEIPPENDIAGEDVVSEASLNELAKEAPMQTTSEQAVEGVAEGPDETAPLVLPDTNEAVAEPQPFTTVETDFDVLMNGSPERVGTAKIYYSKATDQRYELTWKVSATGLIGLVYPDLTQTSQGRIMEFGLMPDFYQYQFGEGESRSYQASFDWVGKEVALQNTKGTKTVTMDAEASAGHIQDFLSFMYQFMFAPPLDEMQMYLTNGRKMGLYTYAFEGEETLELKFGNVNTYHIQHAKTDSDEKTELWLATDYRYVPVRIRKTEKDGTVIEQIATRLKFETLENETPLP
jgi:hypothetical protein